MSIDTRAAEQGMTGKPFNELGEPTLTSGQGCETIDGVREVPIASLAPGRKFELVLTATTRPPYKRIRGMLVRKGPGTVAIAVDKGGREFGTAEGGKVIIPGTTEILYWSPGTPVIPLTTRDSSGKERPLTGDISKWTTKGGTGVGPDMHHPDNYTKTAPEGEKEEGDDVGDRVATLPGTGKGKGKTKVTGTGKAKVVKAKTPKELHPCLCGCGDRVAGRFRQGHDGRYYSILRKVVAGDMEFSKIPRQMQTDLGNVAGAKKALKDSGH